MPKVSVIIPTHKRPEMLKRAVASVERQTYRDFELIVIEDAKSRGGGWARNQGIKKARGKFIAFLDDDDQWLPEKLKIQTRRLEAAGNTVGFSFTAARMISDNGEKISIVQDGIENYFDLALEYFNGFLNVTLMIKRAVLDDVGLFDETLPSHQETDLVLRMAKRYQGLGISHPLTVVNMKRGYDRIGGNIPRRIAGREIILKKYAAEYANRPRAYAQQLFSLGILYRDNRQYHEARACFFKALYIHWTMRYTFHAISMIFDGKLYRFFRMRN